MRITRKQQEEVDFIVKEWEVSPTQEHIEDYIQVTVHGKATDKSFEALHQGQDNPLLQAKRRLDIMAKMWAEGLASGTVGYWELKESFNDPYFERLISSLLKTNKQKTATKLDCGNYSLAITNRMYDTR